MADYYLQNEKIKIGINSHGAELVNLIRLSDDREYMWCGDSAYWGRVSPVLFPFVGKLVDQSYTYDDKTYENIPQHGFARDCDFTMVEQADNCIWFELRPDEAFLANYPFQFLLRIGYRIENTSVHVMWTVRNDDSKDLHFSIGAHPAFYCEGMDKERKYSLNLYTPKSSISSGILNDKGVLSDRTKDIMLTDGEIVMSQELFAEDALIISPEGINTIGIKDDRGVEFLRVKFDAPQLGLWSPVGKNAPFVCIEPWFGRSDRADFAGKLEDREYGNTIQPGHSFNKEYVIEI